MDSIIRSIIDRIWTNFWEGGVTNPLTVIEQITYLLFVKGLDEIEISHEKNDVLQSHRSLQALQFSYKLYLHPISYVKVMIL